MGEKLAYEVISLLFKYEDFNYYRSEVINNQVNYHDEFICLKSGWETIIDGKSEISLKDNGYKFHTKDDNSFSMVIDLGLVIIYVNMTKDKNYIDKLKYKGLEWRFKQ